MQPVFKAEFARIGGCNVFDGDKPVPNLVRAGSKGLRILMLFDIGVVFMLFIRAP